MESVPIEAHHHKFNFCKIQTGNIANMFTLLSGKFVFRSLQAFLSFCALN